LTNLYTISNVKCTSYMSINVTQITIPTDNTMIQWSGLPKSGTSKKGFGQVKIMKKIVWINRQCFLNLVFEQVGEKKLSHILLKNVNTALLVLTWFGGHID
jgi:hypothetical protein